MTADVDRRRPLLAMIILVALIGTGLVVPLLVGGPKSDPALQGSIVRADERDSFSLSVPVTLIRSPHLVLEQGTISVAARSDGTPLSGEAIFTLLNSGSANLVLDDATLTLDRTTAQPTSGPDSIAAGAGETMGPMLAALTKLGFQTLTLHDATIVIRTKGGGEETLRSVNATITSKPEATIGAKGTLSLRGEQLTFDVLMAQPSGTNKGRTDIPLPIRASVTSGLLAASFEGRVVPDLLQFTAKKADLKVLDLREAARWLGAAWPSGSGLATFEAKGPLEWNEDAISFENAAFSLDGNSANGALSLSFAGEHPTLEGTLAFDSLNLSPYFAKPPASPALAAATDWLAYVGFPGAASPSLIRELDADLRVSATSVTIADQTLNKCAASINVKDGKLFADLAEIELENGGTGDGQIGMDMSGPEPHYTMRGHLDGFDIGRLSGLVTGGHHLVEGTGAVIFDFAGEGATGDAVLASLSGNVNVDMSDGARLGLDLDGFANAAEPAQQAAGWGPVIGKVTSVDSFVARFAAASGVFTAQSVQANAGERMVTAAGTVNVAEGALDLTVLISHVLAESAGGRAAPSQPGPKAYRIRGPWKAPTIGSSTPGKSAQPAPELVPVDDRG